LPMAVIRVAKDPAMCSAIMDAAVAFEERLAENLEIYQARHTATARLIPTQRRVEMEMRL
jgi:hypothetical protein